VNYGLPVPPLGGLGSIFVVAVLAYAAVRHRLMDINVFVLRMGANVLSGMLVVLPLTAAVLWSQDLPTRTGGLLVVSCLLVAALSNLLMFSRVRAYVEQELDRSFRPARYAARNAIRQLSAELVQLPKPSNLAEMLTTHLMDGLEVSGVALYLRPAHAPDFALASKAGTIETPPAVACPPTTTTPATSPEAAALGWDTCIPVRSRDTELGFLALTPKRTAAAIEDAEVTLLGIVAAQLAIALQNVEYVREIERQTAEIEELRKRLEAENVSLRAQVRAVSQFKEIIGSSAALQDALARVESVAPTPLTVLITGETGTGKELIARAIHERSPRCNGPLISVNCAAIPTALTESELFGHERGAFTDAVEARPGKFELAAGGTLFLDEVAELPVSSQVKLLRVLEQREAQRIGGRKTYKVDCRVIAATNRDLKAEMRTGTFREDLYFRLNGMPVHVPPLRERVDDIPMLATFFLQRAATTYQKNVTGFTAEALAALGRYNWPGNIRELQHVVERAVLLCGGDVLRPQHLSDLAPAAELPPRPDSLSACLREEKIRRVQFALAQCGGNQAAAARLLGMSRSNFGRLLKSLGLKAQGSAMQ
jgi:transcriptional regulator with GAF, ATPase, and Fis domain